MSGGVGPWSWAELGPILSDIDALYVNFISGFELELETAKLLRVGYAGPIYADLHSIFLGIDASGQRVPRPLDRWREWLRCFDVVQVNEDELANLARAWGDPWLFASDVVGDELRLLLVTLAGRGAAYFASAAFRPDPRRWQDQRGRVVGARPLVERPTISSEHVPVNGGAVVGDPTGCGDVWGATCYASLLAGRDLRDAVEEANAAAARNLTHRGAGGLYDHLRGRLGS